MLSDREQRILDEIERSYADVGAAPRGKRPPAPRRLWLGERPWVWLAVGFVAVAGAFLIIAGAGSGGLALAVAGALGWLLRHYWPWLRAQGVAVWAREDAVGGSAPDRATRRSGIFQRSAD
jgi:hypothetical protein